MSKLLMQEDVKKLIKMHNKFLERNYHLKKYGDSIDSDTTEKIQTLAMQSQTLLLLYDAYSMVKNEKVCKILYLIQICVIFD